MTFVDGAPGVRVLETKVSLRLNSVYISLVVHAREIACDIWVHARAISFALHSSVDTERWKISDAAGTAMKISGIEGENGRTHIKEKLIIKIKNTLSPLTQFRQKRGIAVFAPNVSFIHKQVT